MSENAVTGALDALIPDVKFGKVDVEKLGENLADIITKSVEGLVKGAQSDLALYANRMANDAIRVMRIADVEKRDRLLNELAMQMKLIGEIHRIQATQEGWDVAGKIFKTILKTAVGLLVPA